MRARITPGPHARPAPGISSPSRVVPLRRDAPQLVSTPAQSTARLPLEPRALWIGVHLPQLPLEALTAGVGEGPELLAVAELQGSAQCIVAASELAARAGVRAGLSLASALALVPQLEVRTRDPHRERVLLERLASIALGFTPRVSLVPPDGLLLEVKGSLRLFGGASKLGASLLKACRAAGARPKLALAPTALAALAGARFLARAQPGGRIARAGSIRAGGSFKVTDESRLVGALAPLPLDVLRWPARVLERLAKAGVRTIGEALRLPRAGFARRFGVDMLASLDRLTGRAADPRRSFQARERFRMRRGCTYDLERHETILAALTPLFEALGKFLEARQCGITELECRLWHRVAPVTCCVLRLAAPAADAASLQALLGERLTALTLPEPVRSFELCSDRLVPRALNAGTLWQPGEHGGSGAGTQSIDLIELLRARLGREAVHGLAVQSTHRPEAASRRVEPAAVESGAVMPRTAMPGPGAATAGAEGLTAAQRQSSLWPAFRRPLWLLAAPEPLSESNGLPRRHGPLRLLGEPERIETGWWEEEGDVARDYYQAIDIRGVRLWVYRERTKPHRWFLQGVFG